MKCLTELPQGYERMMSIDLQKDKKLFLIVNGGALFIMILLIAIGNMIVPVSSLFSGWNLALVLFGIVVYMVLHEWVHGLCMKYFGSKTVTYGFTGVYAYAGSRDYYSKRMYMVIALAPVVIWGIVLLLLNTMVDMKWFWGIYFIQITNLSGAAGDLYVTWLFSRLPEQILIQDSGISMVVYSAAR